MSQGEMHHAQEEKQVVFPQDDTPPNSTLYVSNLNEKIDEKELKRDLDAIFNQFGKVSIFNLYL